jgi:hypothetical protein
MSEKKFTPILWVFDGYNILADEGKTIVTTVDGSCRHSDTDEANAALIVKAVNNHEKLVDMLQEIMKYSAATLARDTSGFQLMRPHYEKAQALLTEITNG